MLRVACGAVVIALACAGAASAQAPLPGYGTNDYGGFRNVLPPGTNGLVNAPALVQYELNRTRPAHNDDQLAMYRDLVFAAPGLAPADVSKYYKDATFGIKPQDVGSTESPVAGATIVRDKRFAVPHIYGETRGALMFAIGYATGEDRLFFIDVLRHLGRGQLTSFIGGSPGNRDFDASQWAIAPYSDADLQRQISEGIARGSDIGRQIYDDGVSMIAGINAYIAAAKLNPNLMPAEYAAIGRPLGPDDFQLSDLVAIASLVGGIFGSGGGEQLQHAQLLQSFEKRFGAQLGDQHYADFTGIDDPETPTTVHDTRFPYQLPPARIAPGSVAMPDAGSVVPVKQQVVTGGGSAAAAPAADTLGRRLARILSAPHGASNALLVSGRLSQSGHPLAVFGPQVAYFAPEILMEEDIHGPGIDAAGAAFPGVNLYVELGHGRDYAWSATSAGQDITDVFALPLCNPNGGPVARDSAYYEFRGQCLAMEAIQRVNRWQPNLADQTPPGTETLTAYRTKLGLLIARATVGGKPVAYVKDRTTYNHELDSAIGFEQFNDPNAIRDVRDFQHAASNIGYTFNWFYADSDHIGYFNSGANPVRAPGIDPRFPTWGAFEWQGFDPSTNSTTYTPFEQHPQAIDQNYITSWNNKQAHGFQLDGSPIYRSQPLDDGILAATAGGRKMSLTELIDAMENAATVDLRASKVLGYALKVLGDPADPALGQAAAALRAWLADGAHRRSPALGRPYAHSDAIRIWDAWWPRLVGAVFEPGLGKTLYDQVGVAGDDTPQGGGAHHGSSWQSDNYGRVQKDLRELLGLPVKGRYHRIWCGGGSLAGCRAALEGSLRQAAAEPATKVYPGDGQCPAGDQTCWDSIEFFPIGAVHQPLIPWQNRPTFQQADEIQGHRPVPTRPDCITDLLPRARVTHLRASRTALGVAGVASPLDCGDGWFALARVRVSVARRLGHGRCAFVVHGRLGRPRRCDAPSWLAARGTKSWSLRTRARLTPGSYVVRAEAADSAGNTALAAKRFRIK